LARVALYRKYRPQDFAKVGGQEHIMKTLQNAVKASNFSHAYIFCGPRGIGKTSVARIMAKAVNCSSPKDGNPCNKCSSCTSVNSQTALDIIEIDAASNRGIDEIRDLREKVKFTPSELKYKVFIIDEVHMLTKEAFNALLKTLEEPPSHALFILATTEIHKIPATVISRCQRFDFKKISREELEKGLVKIVKAEKIKIKQEALNIIAKASDGGFRDAISILDQVSMNAGNKEITEGEVAELLGMVDGGKISELMDVVEKGDKKEALELLSVLLSRGGDIGQITKGLMSLCREKVKENLENSDLTDKYVYAIEVLSDSNKDFKHALHPQLSLEVAIIKIINKFGDRDRLSRDNSDNSGDAKSNTLKPDMLKKIKDKEEPVREEASGEIKWDQVLFEIKSKNNSIHAFVRESEPVFIEDEIKLIFPYKFHKERIEDRRNKKIVEEAIQKVCGREYIVVCELGKAKVQTRDDSRTGKKEAEKGATETDILDILGGEVLN